MAPVERHIEETLYRSAVELIDPAAASQAVAPAEARSADGNGGVLKQLKSPVS